MTLCHDAGVETSACSGLPFRTPISALMLTFYHVNPSYYLHGLSIEIKVSPHAV